MVVFKQGLNLLGCVCVCDRNKVSFFSVTEFSKLTGDFRSLSAVDLRVMALTYQLEKEHCGTEHIRIKPTRQVNIASLLKHWIYIYSITAFSLRSRCVNLSFFFCVF